MAQYQNDEIDLGVLFNKIGELYRRFLVFIYNCIRFVFKHWIILLLLIILGAVGGHYWQKASPAEKATTLIIQNNFDSSHYVYGALETLARKHRRGDGPFLKKYGFDKVPGSIIEIEIEPIVNILDLIDQTNDVTGRSLEEYLAQADFEEDLLQSEVFYNEYHYHKVLITTDGDATIETIEQVMAYLNSNEVLNSIQVVALEETKQRIKGHEQSVKDIEGVFASFGPAAATTTGSQVSVRSAENNNLHLLLQEKKAIMEEIERLKSEILKYDKVVTNINEPILDFTFGFFDNKRVLLPIFLVFLYVLVFVVRGFYKNIKSLAEQKQVKA